MKLLDLFIKKRDELPYEYSFEGERIDYTHLFFSAPNPETQRNGVLSINGMAHATMSHSELIPNDFTDIYYLPFPLDSYNASKSTKLTKHKPVKSLFLIISVVISMPLWLEVI